MITEIKQRDVGKVTVLEVKGRMVLGEASDTFNTTLQNLIAAGRVNLLVDFSQVGALDSQGIAALVRAAVSARKRDGKLLLLRPSPRVLEVLQVTRLVTLMEVQTDEAEGDDEGGPAGEGIGIGEVEGEEEQAGEEAEAGKGEVGAVARDEAGEVEMVLGERVQSGRKHGQGLRGERHSGC